MDALGFSDADSVMTISSFDIFVLLESNPAPVSSGAG
jgi:hypothetical protein